MRNSSLDEFVGGADDESDAERADRETAERGVEGGTESDPETESEAKPEPERESAAAGGQEVDEEAVDGDAQADEAAVEPAVSTLDWTPGGAACTACGKPSERRWRDDGQLVCSSCKTW